MFSFCKPVTSKKRFLPFRKLDEDFSFTLYDHADAVPADQWKAVTGGSTVFLEPAYLRLVETCEHTRLMSRYIIVYRQQQPCGILYCQVVDFKVETFGEILSTQIEEKRSKRLKILENYIGANKDEVLLRLFTCGNNLLSGEFGFLFLKSISNEVAHSLLLNIVEVISKEDKLKGGLSAILLKDFHEPLQPAALFEDEKYSKFLVEPNLIVEVPAGVNNLADYTSLFSKKYRNRAKAIFKSAQEIETRNLSAADISKYESELYALYEQIFEKAKFRLMKLPRHYFAEVKKIYGNQFNVKGFFLQGRIVAFASCFVMPDDSIEAHYIGLDYELNQQYNLYQNILYAMIDEAIMNKRRMINLGRTAAEIKTTVGAKPEDLICYIKAQNTISKMIQRPFIGLLQPSAWTPRNPFKDEGSEIIASPVSLPKT